MGYPEGGGEHVIIVINGTWLGTLVDAASAEELAQFMHLLAATPAENMGWEPIEEVNRALTAKQLGPAKPAAPPSAP
jgi:hypothetical protein